jgi:asparagine synthase (glutamine-hydrolysing)
MEPSTVDRLLPIVLDPPIAERLAAGLARLLAPYCEIEDGRRMLMGDMLTYLPDNMLLRSDKVLMAGSLEGRMPLLDLEVVRRATAAPAGARSSVIRPKRVLREAVLPLVPRELRGGPKRGFQVPVEFLIDGDRGLIEQLLLSDRCLSRGIFEPDGLRTVLADSTGRVSSSTLFVLASLELWARANIDTVSTHPPSAELLLAEDGAEVPEVLRT